MNDTTNLLELEAESPLQPLPTLEEWLPGFQQRRMAAGVRDYEHYWATNRAAIAERNLSYWRGEFWGGDGIYSAASVKAPGGPDDYRADRNEVFPILDTQRSALAKDLPQVEMAAVPIGPDLVAPEQDATWVGRNIAAALNHWAAQDELDVVVQELVMNALVFDEGGYVKTQWSPELGRVTWAIKQPWELFFSNDARDVKSAPWAFERFPLHWDDYAARVNSGAYDRPKKAVRPDQMPRALIDQSRLQDEELLRQRSLAEYVSIIEWWDFRDGMLYHYLPDHNHILMKAPIPYGRPYQVLTFNPGLGRIRAMSDVSLIAGIQRDQNELASARREMIQRLVRKLLVDAALFKDEREWEQFRRARTWEPTRVNVPPGRTLAEFLHVTPEVSTTTDFNNHFAENEEHIRYLSGLADYQRGQRQHFRTAEEAAMVAGATEGRLDTKQVKLVKVVAEMFRCGHEAWKWAAANPGASNFDPSALVQDLGLQVDPIAYTRAVLEARGQFKLLPFSPLMEDRNTRRRTLLEIIERLGQTPALNFIDWKALAREVFELFSLTPSIVRDAPVAPPAQQGVAPDGAPSAPASPPVAPMLPV